MGQRAKSLEAAIVAYADVDSYPVDDSVENVEDRQWCATRWKQLQSSIASEEATCRAEAKLAKEEVKEAVETIQDS